MRTVLHVLLGMCILLCSCDRSGRSEEPASPSSAPRMKYSVFGADPSMAEQFGKSCVALVAWNPAARKLFNGAMPDLYCKLMLGLKGIELLDQRLKSRGVPEGYSDERLIVFNMSRTLSNDQLMQAIVADAPERAE